MTADRAGRETLSGDPLPVLARWIDEAAAAGLPVPGAMTLATADATGQPHARTVLATAVDGVALRFHTSAPTTKTCDLAGNPRASAVFLWAALGRQVVLQGAVEELDPAISRATYPTRPPQLRQLAWAYEELLARLEPPDFAVEHAAVERAFDAAAGRASMPASWTTFRLVPERADFWQAGTDLAPPAKTRFVLGAGRWRSFPAMP